MGLKNEKVLDSGRVGDLSYHLVEETLSDGGNVYGVRISINHGEQSLVIDMPGRLEGEAGQLFRLLEEAVDIRFE